MAERPTFSPFWHRVRVMKPRLRAHVQITRQHYRGRRWHVVHDPATNQFYRLNPVAHEFVALLDGRRTVEDVWQISLDRHGDAAPTQNEVIQLIGQLYNANLLTADVTPETEQLLRRGRDRLKQKAAQQAIGIMYFRMRLFNPDRYLTWLEPIMRPILNRWGLLAWLAFIIVGLANLLPHFDELTNQFENTIAPANWPWLIAVFVVLKAIHETGHGVICKRFGGQVPEMGIMLLVLFPAPYVDASAAWSMASKWQRIAIGAGGMIFELFIATIASIVWLNTVGGSAIHQIAYNAIFTASVSTILFNANPLMRFDGYYILSDLIEVPNLMQRSMNMIKYLLQKYMYRIEQATPPTSIRAEQVILVVYGLGALAYRIFLFFSITLYVMGRLFAIGLVLAIWTAGAWFIIPIGKFLHWLSAGPQLSDHRPRAVITSIAAIAAILVLVGAIPMPDHRRATGVVESLSRSGVFFATDGFVTEAHVRPGQTVHAGDPIVTCDSPMLRSQHKAALADLTRLESIERQATASDPAAAIIARDKVRAQHDIIKVLQLRLEQLVVRAPHDGYYVGTDPSSLVGSFVTRGQTLGEIVDTQHVRVVAIMSQTEADWINELPRDRYTVELRRVTDAGTVHNGGSVRVIPAGQHQLPHGALGYAGGGNIETDKRDRTGMYARRNQFVIHIDLPPDTPTMPGERIKLRFSLPKKPLLFQWLDRLHKLVQGRVNL